MASFKLTHLCFTAVLLSAAFSCCRGQGGGGGAGAGAGGGGGGGSGSGIGAVVPGTQDSVQIVAQAALCFDNRPVLTGCLQAIGINASGTGASMPPPVPGGASTEILCSPPCFGHVTMMMSCVNAIFGNFVTYNPGLMQGVQAVFQMSCGNVNGPGGAGGAPGGGGAAGGMGGGAAGGMGGGGAGAGGASGGVGGGSAGGTVGGMGGGPAGNAGGGAGAGGASGGIGGGAPGGIPNSIGGPGGIPNSMGGGGGAAGASGGGGTGTTNSIGGDAGGGAGAGGASGGAGGANDTANGGAATGAIGSGNITSVSPNAGSHVAVSNQSQPTSSADGPTLSLKGACSSVLVIWAGAWLVLF